MADPIVDTSHGGTARHEPTDIETRPLRLTAIIFGIALIAILFALLGLFRYFERNATAPDREISHLGEMAPTAPEPRIQGVPEFHGNVPRADMEQLRLQAQQRLQSYGRSDDAGFVRIPIDRAIDILADRQTRPATQKTR